MKDHYVILTGSKNDAGDFIKQRAKKPFAALRPVRKIVDLDAWKPFDTATLERVENAKALILMDGPTLQPHMYPGIYALTPDLEDMGIGCKSISGNWQGSCDRAPYQGAP